jgi:purine-binding chemotaxis protein CheW
MTGIGPWSRAAAPPKPPPPPRVQLVTFCVGRETYAADVFAVERVLRYASPRAVAGAPPWLAGTTEYDGGAIPVIDLRARFGVAPAGAGGAYERMLVLRLGESSVAAVVDDVLEVVDVLESALETPPGTGGPARECRRAVLRDDARETVVLDVARLLGARDRELVDQAMAGNRTG